MTMLSTTELRIPANGVRSLVWDGPSLVDWADGGQRYLLDGETVPRSVRSPTLSTQRYRCQAVPSR